MSESLEPKKPKATHKNKRKTAGGFYSEFKRWSVKGKTYKELQLMVEDLKNALKHQLVRIRKHKAVIHFKQEDKARIRTRDRLKIHSRNRRIEKREEDIAVLKKELRAKEVIETRLNDKVKLRDEKIKSLTKSNNSLQAKLKRKENQSVSTPKKVDSVLDRRVKRILAQPLEKRLLNQVDTVVKTTLFAIEHDLNLTQLSAILQVSVCNGIKTNELVKITGDVVGNMRDKGLIKSSYLGANQKMYYHYLTTDGENLVRKFKDYLSYGKGLNYE